MKLQLNQKLYSSFIYILAVMTLISCKEPKEKTMKPKIFPFSIELTSIDPGQYDPSTKNWVQTKNGTSEVIFRYTLKNKIKTIPGKVTAKIGNITFLSSTSFPNNVPEIEADQNFSSEFHTYALPPGTYDLYFTYSTRVTPNSTFSYDSVIAQELFSYYVPPDVVDNDFDGIDDREEKRLLDKFAPFYSFSKEGATEEEYLPTDVLTYIKGSKLITGTDEDHDPVQVNNSDLSATPNKLFFTLPNTIPPFSTNLNDYVLKVPTIYHIDPTDEVRKGSPWDECRSKRNIGLYGHVVPYNQSSAQKDVHDLNMPQNKTFYKIEYWQFFGYNAANANRHLADHEGDWTSVQLLYDPHPGVGEDTIVTVFHYVHGLEFRFDMSAKVNVKTNGTIRTFTGANAKFNPDINIVKLGPNRNFIKSDDFDQTQNNIVYFKQDPNSPTQFTHPIVYIEFGSHEFYPSSFWKYLQARNHDGTGGFQYFCAVPPNLGEVEHPLLEYEGANIVMQFNGFWGAYSSMNNEPGPGPSLHAQWTYPADSKIGWQLHGLPF